MAAGLPLNTYGGAMAQGYGETSVVQQTHQGTAYSGQMRGVNQQPNIYLLVRRTLLSVYEYNSRIKHSK